MNLRKLTSLSISFLLCKSIVIRANTVGLGVKMKCNNVYKFWCNIWHPSSAVTGQQMSCTSFESNALHMPKIQLLEGTLAVYSPNTRQSGK